MKKSRLSAIKILFFILVFFIVSGGLFGFWYVKQLDEVVAAKFEGRKWQFPSKIYSNTYLLYVGMSVRSDELWEKLRRLGYRESRNPPGAKGEFRFLKKEGLLEIYLHDFVYPLESFKGTPIRISLQGATITKMENVDNGEELFSLELEPELVTGLYDRIWEERHLVNLFEVPPLLVRAILAVEDERF
ncbi:MAG: hypothetical protein AAB279_06775, partial [Candidatus Binatota bacterium]